MGVEQTVEKPMTAWQKYPFVTDPNGYCYFETPARNTEAIQEIMEDKELPVVLRAVSD